VGNICFKKFLNESFFFVSGIMPDADAAGMTQPAASSAWSDDWKQLKSALLQVRRRTWGFPTAPAASVSFDPVVQHP
jgi:hypothetical protein